MVPKILVGGSIYSSWVSKYCALGTYVYYVVWVTQNYPFFVVIAKLACCELN